MHEIIQANYAVFITVGFLILFILTSSNFEKRINRLFFWAAACIALFMGAQVIKEIVKLNDGPVNLRIILSAIAYVTPCATLYLSDLILLRDAKRAHRVLLAVPLILCTVIEFSALFCPIAFSYSPDKEFVRGPLGYMPFILSSIYIVFLLYITIRNLTRGRIAESFTTMAVAAVSVVAIIMESGLGYQSFISTSSAVSLSFYYLFFHTNQTSRDGLTQALQRRRFYLDADRKSGTLSAVISIDLNNLKLLNDQYGHDAGDRALVTLADTAQKCLMTRNASLYRTGGDEFMVLCHRMNEKEVRALIARIRSGMIKTPYTCAIGYCMYINSMEIEEVCREADRMMYIDKGRIKSDASRMAYRAAGSGDQKLDLSDPSSEN